jgi:hypothetical protein
VKRIAFIAFLTLAIDTTAVGSVLAVSDLDRATENELSVSLPVKTSPIATVRTLRPAIQRIDPGSGTFDFPRIAKSQTRPRAGIRPLACDTTCYCNQQCVVTSCSGAAGSKCRNNLYCDDCGPPCNGCVDPPW